VKIVSTPARRCGRCDSGMGQFGLWVHRTQASTILKSSFAGLQNLRFFSCRWFSSNLPKLTGECEHQAGSSLMSQSILPQGEFAALLST